MFIVSGVCWSSSKNSFCAVPRPAPARRRPAPNGQCQLVRSVVAHVAGAEIPVPVSCSGTGCCGTDHRRGPDPGVVVDARRRRGILLVADVSCAVARSRLWREHLAELTRAAELDRPDGRRAAARLRAELPTRLCRRAASTSSRPSRRLCDAGFSTYRPCRRRWPAGPRARASGRACDHHASRLCRPAFAVYRPSSSAALRPGRFRGAFEIGLIDFAQVGDPDPLALAAVPRSERPGRRGR